MTSPVLSAAPAGAPRPGAAEKPPSPPWRLSYDEFTAWCRERGLTRADIATATVMATTERELTLCVRAWMRTGPGWAADPIAQYVPAGLPPHDHSGRRPRTFPQLVAAIRRQIENGPLGRPA